MELIVSVFLGIVGLFVLYVVISKAVRDGINQSLVGQSILEKELNRKDRKVTLTNDMDTDY